jgi:molybdopterin-containing oxidoreductase family iron-sulfur binding subunit
MVTILVVAHSGALPPSWRAALRGPNAPHRLVAETHGVDAELLLEARRPDLVLLDLDRPREESVCLCRRLVSAGEATGKRAPVVALAPALDEEERGALLEAGATGYVLKSIEPSQLVIALQAIAEVAGELNSSDEPLQGGRSRSEFLRFTGAAAAAALVVPRAGRAAPSATNPSPSSSRAMPKLPAPAEDESDLLRMQRELVAAMKRPVAERKWVMVIDLRKCSGCDACTIACKAENQLPPGVVYRPVVEEVVGTYPNVRRRFLPRPCMQCEKPPCTPVCPVGATWRREDGVVAIDYEKCIGCRYCLAACPYSARTFDSGEYYTDGTPARQPYEEQVSPEYDDGLRRANGDSPIGNARKCHFCLHRLEAGMLPACVTSCIGHATYFGDANDPRSLVAELIGRPEARRLKEELGTKPRVYYLT